MIVGNKVYLRPIVRDDLVNLNKWKNDSEIYKYLGGGFMPVSIDQQLKWLDSYIDTTGNNKRFIICQVEGDQAIGMIGLYDINWIHRVCEIGVFIGDRQVRGKGYAKEACLLLEIFASEYLNLRKIKLSVVSENKQAIKLWNSLGYQIVGEYLAERFIEGSYQNVTLMEKFTKKSIGGGRLTSCLPYLEGITFKGRWAA